MKYEFFIARRYLFSKKSHHAINIISGISVFGVALGTMALVVTLSVFNGFQDLIAQLFTAFDPQLKVSLVEGKTIRANDPALVKLKAYPGVELYMPCLEDQALVVHDNKQIVATIKGVEDNFIQQKNIQQLLYPQEHITTMHADVIEYGILGLQLASKMGLQAYFPDPLPIYAPRKGERVNMGNPMSSFNTEELNSPGVVFQVYQSKYDANYILTSLQLAQRLFDREGEVSQVELKLRKGVDEHKAKAEIKELLGKRFRVENRFEQQADVFKIMGIEKLIAYLFLTFILLVACFNIIGSLSMLMIDKKRDVNTLKNLGATNRQIANIFMIEGRLITTCGAILGVIAGLVLCWLQQEYGLISMGQSEGDFIVDSYPVSVHLTDVALIFVTVIAVGWLAVWYPVRYLGHKILRAKKSSEENEL